MPDTNIEMKFDVFVIMLHSFTIQSLNVSAYFSDFNYRSRQKYIKVQSLYITCSDFCIVFEPTNSSLLSTEHKFHNISLVYKTEQL